MLVTNRAKCRWCSQPSCQVEKMASQIQLHPPRQGRIDFCRYRTMGRLEAGHRGDEVAKRHQALDD